MSDDHREDLDVVLRRVAAGEITPEEALALLGENPAAGSPQPPATSAPSAVPSAVPVDVLRVRSSYRSLEIVGDPQVAQALVTGEHLVQLDNGVMTVTTPSPLDSDSESPLFSFSALPRTLNWIRSWRDRQVRIRVNPAIALELELTGVELNLAGVTSRVSGAINASAVKLDRISGAIDLQTFSSSMKGTVVLQADSRLVAESSSVRLTLGRGSTVRVEATSKMGRLSLPDDAAPSLLDGELRQFSVGGGEHLFTVESVMSSVTVDTPTWAASA